MILREIVHTCSNVHVAGAALASIGGEFAAHFAHEASRCNMPADALAARMVRNFSAHADVEQWDGVGRAVRGADQPILSGLRYILSQGLGDSPRDEDADEEICAPWMRRDSSARYCCA